MPHPYVHLSCCYAADALLDASPQVRLPQVVQPHAAVGADQGLPKGRWRKCLCRLVLDCIPALQLLLYVLCRANGKRQTKVKAKFAKAK